MTHIESGFKLKVLGVGSSMRQGSYSTAALNMILDMAKGNEAETKLLDLRQTNLPMLYTAKDDTHEIGQATELVEWADAYILALVCRCSSRSRSAAQLPRRMN
jgi:NAD(P)H-dependent FMN reductase